MSRSVTGGSVHVATRCSGGHHPDHNQQVDLDTGCGGTALEAGPLQEAQRTHVAG